MDPRMSIFVSNEAQNNILLADAQAVAKTFETAGEAVSGIFGIPTGQAPPQGSGPLGYLTIAELEAIGYVPTEDKIYLTLGKPGATGGCEDAGPFHIQLNDPTQQPTTRLETALAKWNIGETPQQTGAELAYRAIATSAPVQAVIASTFGLAPKS